jgi:glucose-6-phosphate 1-epimerase/putative transcriptional regulator
LAIDPRSLGDADRQLLDMHQRYLGSWQEVVLVIKDDAEGAVGVVLNRPAATEGAPHLSRALVEALESDGGAKVTTDAFDGAFGKTIAAYVGKPAAREGGSANKAMVVHGLDDVEGARELAPNLGIYRGGAAAAAERVQAGTAEPLDFRFFIGRYEWGPGELARDVRDGVYRPAACSRGVALKQCLGLPKPLWHEVMDMLGGSSADVSALELARRSDQ